MPHAPRRSFPALVDAAGRDPGDPEQRGFACCIGRFARRHRQVLNEVLGTDFGKEPSDSTFRLLLSQLDVAGFETLLRQLMSAQPGVAEGLDTLVCDGKTLRGSIAETGSGAATFIAQVSLYSQSLGYAIAQTTYATDAGSETQALRQLLEAIELEGVLVQADALHANRPFSSSAPSAVPTS